MIEDRQHYAFRYVVDNHMLERMSDNERGAYMAHMFDEALWKMGYEIAKRLVETEHGCVVRIDEHEQLVGDQYEPWKPAEEHRFSIFMNPVRTMEYVTPVFNAPDWRLAMGPTIKEPSNPTEIRCQHCWQLNSFDSLECRKCGAPLYKQEEFWE